MFIQVWQGKVSNVAAIRERLDGWRADLEPTAQGWLGFTGGVTADGQFVGIARFVDEASARSNSDRPEQEAWWAGTADLFEGDVEFHDYPHTTLLLDGGSDAAGFVQVIQGTYSGDGSPADATDDAEELSRRRPDIIGATIGWNDAGHFTQTVYFTTEEAARRGEETMGADADADADADAADRLEEWMSRVEGLTFHDLTEPWMASP